MLAVGDKRLLPRQAIGVAIPHRARLDALHVRPARGFGHRQCTNQFARDHLRQPTLFLVFRPVFQNVMRDDARMNAVTPARQIGAGSLHQDHRLVAEISTSAAIFFRNRRAEQAKFSGLRPCLAIHLTLLAPCVIKWLPLGLDEFGRHLGEHFMLVAHPA